jgi:prepilin peptidase CpaA
LTTLEIIALAVVGIAAYTDVRARRVPNWLTVSGLVLGLVLHLELSGWPGLKISLGGAALALLVLFPVVLMRGLGAGDWKLFGALGAILGPTVAMVVLFFAIMIGGVMALFLVIRRRMLLTTLKNMWILVKSFFIYGIRPHTEVSLDNPSLLKLPFAVATALATLLVFTGGHIFR